MLRFVLGPDRVVVPDLAARLPGRGIWLSARRDVLETARAKGILASAFARQARAQVAVPDDLHILLRTGLVRRIGELLGLSRRAGQAVCGYTKAREWLQAGRAALVVQASDGSPEERLRFMGASRAGDAAQAGVPVIAPLDAASLGAVFGRDRAVHVAVGHGSLAERLRIEAERLAGVSGQYRTDQGG